MVLVLVNNPAALLSLTADVKLLENQPYVESVYEQVNAAMLEYILCAYPQLPDRFSQILLRLPELRALSAQAEDYLCYKHLSGEVPCNNLLIEMLHAKRTCIWHTHTHTHTLTGLIPSQMTLLLTRCFAAVFFRTQKTSSTMPLCFWKERREMSVLLTVFMIQGAAVMTYFCRPNKKSASPWFLWLKPNTIFPLVFAENRLCDSYTFCSQMNNCLKPKYNH